MGFGGFFNYSKPGPGIRKDAPEKKRYIVFFETWFRNIWKLLPSGCLYVLFNLLIIPSGLGSAGFTHIARNTAIDKHSFGISDFFETIHKNWKQSLIMGIINVIVTTIIMLSAWFYFGAEGIMGMLGRGLMVSAFFVISVMKYYVWLLIITFKLPLIKIIKNAFYFVFINLKNNVIVGLCSLIWYALAFGIWWIVKQDFMLFLVVALTVLFYPGFKHLLIQFCVFPSVKKIMIDPYYEEHPDADIEVRKNLGLIAEEETEDDSVFNDKQFVEENDK